MNATPPQPLGRILLVEDDITLANLYQMRLETEGFQVRHCSNGEDALQMAKAYQPNLILLDIMMPGLNGFDVLDILRHTPGLEKTKILILSAMGQPADQARAKSLGADDYLIKSQVVIADVMARIRHHLNLPAAPAA